MSLPKLNVYKCIDQAVIRGMCVFVTSAYLCTCSFCKATDVPLRVPFCTNPVKRALWLMQSELSVNALLD